MTSPFGFYHTHNLFWVLFVAAVIFVVVAFTEWLRADKSKVVLRLLAILLSIISLVCIILQPYWMRHIDSALAIVLTPGADKVDSLKQQYPKARILQWHDTLQAYHLPPSIIVHGHGIPDYDLDKFKAKQVQFIAAAQPKGIVQLAYQSEYQEGDELALTMVTNEMVGQKLVLAGFGQTIDSLVIKDQKEVVTFQFPLKTKGRFVLQIKQYTEQGELERSHPLPIQVQEARHYKLLIINSFPTFENKFVKNYLAENGHHYLVRNTITTNRYRYEYQGDVSATLPSITQEVLRDFDLVMIDVSSFSKLTTTEKNSLSTAIKGQGTGLLVQMNDPSLFNKLPDWFRFNIAATKTEFFDLPITESEEKIATSGFVIKSNPWQKDILQANNETFAANRLYGIGKIGLMTLQNSYELVLAGKEDDFKNLWKQLFEEHLKTSNQTFSFTNEAYVHEPTYLTAISNVTPVVKIGDVDLPVRQHELLTGRWYGQYWPQQVGWEPILCNGDTTWRYVFDSDNWQAKRWSDNSSKNAQHFKSTTKGSTAVQTEKTKLSLWWFYLLFVISMAYLWLEPKLK